MILTKFHTTFLYLSLLISTIGFAQNATEQETFLNYKISPVSECEKTAFKTLNQYYPFSLQVYERISDKRKNHTFIKCDDKNTIEIDSLNTFTHENIHIYGHELSKKYHNESYLLLNGYVTHIEYTSELLDPQYYRSKLLSSLSIEERNSEYTRTYFEDEMGEQSFLVLLDELNAYAHGLDASVHLPIMKEKHYSEIDGLAAMMVYTLRYYQTFHKSDLGFYNNTLMSKQVRHAVSTLLAQAKNAILSATNRDDLNVESKIWIDAINSKELQSEWYDLDQEQAASKIQLNIKLAPDLIVYHLELDNKDHHFRYVWNGHFIEFNMNSDQTKYLSFKLNNSSISEKEYYAFLNNNKELKTILENGYRVREETSSFQVTKIKLEN